MYKKILVPLDGSKLAECVLPHVQTVVRGCEAPEVIFIRVVERANLPVGGLGDGGPAYTESEAEQDRKETDSRNRADAEEYLGGIAGGLEIGAASSQRVVLAGKPAETIADYATKNGADLVVIATHGRSGVSRWIWGSTADRILRSACVPVLMVRAPGCPSGL